MALDVTCPKGHPYVQADLYRNLPKGAPVCPVCYEEWKELKFPLDMQKVLAIFAEHGPFIKEPNFIQALPPWSNLMDSDPGTDLGRGHEWLARRSGDFAGMILIGSRAMLIMGRHPDFQEVHRFHASNYRWSSEAFSRYAGSTVVPFGRGGRTPTEVQYQEWGLDVGGILVVLPTERMQFGNSELVPWAEPPRPIMANFGYILRVE